MYSVENMHKEGYNDDQIKEIQEGLKKGVDVSKYKLIDFIAIQMREIRLGLEEGLNVDLYAKSEFDWLQMMEIRKGLENGVEAKLYAKPKVSYDKMREIRKGLEAGYVLVMYLQYEAGIIREIRKALEDNLDIKEFVDDGYDTEQLECIRKCLKDNIDIKKYITDEFRGAAIKEVAKGIQMHLDVEVYADVKYNWQQMAEIRKGLENRLDVTKYTNENYSWLQMREIRKGLEKGLNVSEYSSLMYTANEMKKIRRRIWNGVVDTNDTYIHKKVNGIEITISVDEMEAYIKLPEEQHEEYTIEEIKEELYKYDIIEGINDDWIKDAMENAGTSMLVAAGSDPIDGEDGYNEYMFKTDVSRQPKILPDGSVDYADIAWFESVTEGSVVAVYHEATDGTFGRTVKGKGIAPNKGKEKAIHELSGCKLLEDKKTYVATQTGKIELIDNKIIVTSLFELDEVTNSGGYINFNGDVYVKGNVGTGAVINTTGDVVVCGFVEGAEINAGGNVEIRLGVNASNKGCITAKGNIHSKYFENAIIRAEGEVHVNNILNSDVQARGKIVVSGRKGSIVGGNTYSFTGIESTTLGNIARMATNIKLGVDDKLVDRYNETIAKITDIKKEIDILSSAYEDIQRKHPPEVRNVMDMFIKIEKALAIKNRHYNEALHEKEGLKLQLDSARAAKAVITGNLYEGVVITIDNSTWRSPGVKNVIVEKKIDDLKVGVKHR